MDPGHFEHALVPQLARRLEPRAAARRPPSEDSQVTLHRNCSHVQQQVDSYLTNLHPDSPKLRRQLTKLVRNELADLLGRTQLGCALLEVLQHRRLRPAQLRAKLGLCRLRRRLGRRRLCQLLGRRLRCRPLAPMGELGLHRAQLLPQRSDTPLALRGGLVHLRPQPRHRLLALQQRRLGLGELRRALARLVRIRVRVGVGVGAWVGVRVGVGIRVGVSSQDWGWG
jgi:hypothetical protein